MTRSTIPHTRLAPAHPARVGPPRPPSCHRPTPAAHPLPKVDYILRPRPLPISGAFPPDQLRAMIDRLPDERHRELITLRYLHGYQVADIAATMAYDRTNLWRMEKAAIHPINQMVRQKTSTEAVPAKTRATGRGWVGAAFVAGLVLMAVAWWIIDTALLTSPAGTGTVRMIDLDSLRPWLFALGISGLVVGWWARISYERMPARETKAKGGNADGL